MSQPYGPPQGRGFFLKKLEDTPPVSPSRTPWQALQAQKGIEENSPKEFPETQST